MFTVSLASPKALDSLEGDNIESPDSKRNGNSYFSFPIIPVPAKMHSELSFTRIKYISEGGKIKQNQYTIFMIIPMTNYSTNALEIL